jgi:di/tricarboxylate transporter
METKPMIVIIALESHPADLLVMVAYFSASCGTDRAAF